LGEAWDEALAAGGPVLLEVKTDPEVPPLSPHNSFEQTRHFAEALVKDKPHREGVIAGTARQVLSAILTGGKK
jgi:pyruvate dehydrogenase (quinone)